MRDKPNSEYEPATERETVSPGDRVRLVNIPSRMSREALDGEPKDTLGRVDDVVQETVNLGPSSSLEQELAVVKTDDGEESRVNVGSVNNELDADDGGVSLIPLKEPGGGGGGGFGGGGGGFFRGGSDPTDIGREADGEFARPETASDIKPAPIARNDRTGKFGLDPFDLTSGGVGESVDLFDERDQR